MKYRWMLLQIILTLNMVSALGQITKEKTVRFWIANHYRSNEEKLNNRLIDAIEATYVVEGLHYPKIIGRKDSTLLITNSIIYDSDNLAEYVVPDRSYKAKRFIRAFEVNEFKVRGYLNLGEYKSGDEFKQLNGYDRYIYCLCLRDYRLNLVAYDTLEKRFSSISVLEDRIDLEKSANDVLFFFSKELLLMANPYKDAAIVFDQIPYYVPMPYEAIGVAKGLIYCLSSATDVWCIDYKTGIPSKVGNLQLDVSNKSLDYSYFLDPSDMRLYVSYFDLPSLSLISNVYKILK